MYCSVCANGESGMFQDIVNPDDQHCDPVLHVLNAKVLFVSDNVLKGKNKKFRQY